MHQLALENFPVAGALFAQLAATQPMCAAVLAGVYPGRVYVDQPEKPRSALLLTFIESESSGVWAFLAGAADNPVFNQAVNQAVRARTCLDPRTPIIFWTCDPEDWGGRMAEIFAPLPPLWTERYHYVARQVGGDWREALPAGFELLLLESALRQVEGLELPEDVAVTLEKWEKLADTPYAARGFMDYGCVVLDTRRPPPVIASWATVDFIANGHGDLGFFTQPEYRQKGLGTLAVWAALEHGFRRGLQQVNWTCEADNPGSFKTAEKLGLKRIGDYRMAFWLMDDQRHQQVFERRQAG